MIYSEFTPILQEFEDQSLLAKERVKNIFSFLQFISWPRKKIF